MGPMLKGLTAARPRGFMRDMTTPITRHRAPAHGFSVALPADWQALVERPGLSALLARDPREDGGQHPSFLVDVRPMPERLTLEDYELQQQQGLPQQVDGYQCLEISRTTVAGAPALYRLCDYLFGDISMTGIQWMTLHSGDIVTLSATVRTSGYPEVADTFDAIVDSLTWEAA